MVEEKIKLKAKELEEKYGVETRKLMKKYDIWCYNADLVYPSIPSEVKIQWYTYYEICVRSSTEYKMYIWFNNFFKKF